MNESLSTGQIAEYCGVHLRTVIRWIDQGYLVGYKLPGRGNNRVLKQEFINFLRKQNMPIPEELKSKTKNVLIVEDDIEMANAIMRAMRKEGWNTIHAKDGFIAGLALAKQSVDLITLDLMMPKMNGFDLLETLAADKQLCYIPVLVISASSEDLLNKALAMGAKKCLNKPFNNKELIDSASQLTQHTID